MIFKIPSSNEALFSTIYKYFYKQQNSSKMLTRMYINYKDTAYDQGYQKEVKLEDGNFKLSYYYPNIYFITDKFDPNCAYAIPIFLVQTFLCDKEGNLIKVYEGKEVEVENTYELMYLHEDVSPRALSQYATAIHELNYENKDFILSRVKCVEYDISGKIAEQLHLNKVDHNAVCYVPIKHCPLACMPERGAVCLYDATVYEMIQNNISSNGTVNIQLLTSQFKESDIAKELFKSYLETTYETFSIFSKRSALQNTLNLNSLMPFISYSNGTPPKILTNPGLLNQYPPLPVFTEDSLRKILLGNIPIYFQSLSSVEKKPEQQQNTNIKQATITQCYFIDPMLPFKDIIQNNISKHMSNIKSAVAISSMDLMHLKANELCPDKGFEVARVNRLYDYKYPINLRDKPDGKFALIIMPVYVYCILLQYLKKVTYGKNNDISLVDVLLYILDCN